MRPARTVLLGLLVVALAGWAFMRKTWSEPPHKPRHATPVHSEPDGTRRHGDDRETVGVYATGGTCQ